MLTITLDECHLIFNEFEKLKKFLSDKYKMNEDEVNILLFSSMNSYKNKMLIDIVYDSYVYLGSIENKNQIENGLYNKVLEILNYHIRIINFRDKESRFIKEFEYALSHYDNINSGIKR